MKINMTIFLSALIIAFLLGCDSILNSDSSESGLIQLTFSDKDTDDAAFSSDGELIYYTIWQSEISDIRTVSIAGDSDEIILSDLYGGINSKPIISTDGNLMAFRLSVGMPDIHHLVLCNTDGLNLTNLAICEISSINQFNNDGTKLLYGEMYAGIHIIDVPSSQDEILPIALSGVYPVSFSKDESKILFSSFGSQGNSNTCEYDLSNHSYAQITSDTLGVQPICYSPDGTKILGQSRLLGSDDLQTDWEIFILGSDDSTLLRLTDNEIDDKPICFSPDGNHILYYTMVEDEGWDIMIMDVDGANIRKVVDNSANDLPFGFSPDGTKILFKSNRDGNYNLYLKEF